jgi:asparagine synthase (glutamine-hydrolysing)
VCGICGKIIFDRNALVEPALVKRMLNTVRHRGPDDEGVYTSSGIGLGHRRLSIIGLSTGHQPLCNEDRSIWITFNGEIYNYQELRSDLIAKGHAFATETDTEVIVHLYEELGANCVTQLRGMFAFAIWDSRQDVLFLARDRVGIKPLYYWQNHRSLVFGSEIKSILADPEVESEVDPAMIDRLLTFFYLPGEQTLFRNVKKLPPASYMLIKAGRSEIHTYWDLHFDPSPMPMAEAEARLASLLEESVKLHMISDVPVGVLLSGGLDSTAMLSIASEAAGGPLSTFTVGFDARSIEDERPYARMAAQMLGARHHEITITAKEFREFLPKYVWHMEEPICEPPAVALYYVSKLASESVKVLISGEGGDEAFGGYPEYRNLLWLERLKSALGPVKGPAGACLNIANSVLRSDRLARYASLFSIPLSSYYQSRAAAPARSLGKLYSREFAIHAANDLSKGPVRPYFENVSHADVVSQMLYVDTKTWLPDELLLKADKITMANSVELRVPLLDHKLLEFAASLPADYKVRGFKTKFIAKKVLAGRVPPQIINRKKAGFPVPYSSWMRSEMKGWVQELLLDRKSLGRGYFDGAGVENLITENEGSGRHSKVLFTLVALELWHREFLDHAASASRSFTPAEIGIRL